MINLLPTPREDQIAKEASNRPHALIRYTPFDCCWACNGLLHVFCSFSPDARDLQYTFLKTGNRCGSWPRLDVYRDQYRLPPSLSPYRSLRPHRWVDHAAGRRTLHSGTQQHPKMVLSRGNIGSTLRVSEIGTHSLRSPPDC